MKNKVIMALVLTATLLVGVMIGGCGSNISSTETNTSDSTYFEKIGNPSTDVAEYKDTQTGVHYFFNYRGGMCPRYDAYGDLYVD